MKSSMIYEQQNSSPTLPASFDIIHFYMSACLIFDGQLLICL